MTTTITHNLASHLIYSLKCSELSLVYGGPVGRALERWIQTVIALAQDINAVVLKAMTQLAFSTTTQSNDSRAMTRLAFRPLTQSDDAIGF